MVLKKDSKLNFPHLLLIDASAGSGKTHTLTQRFIQFLLSKTIENSDLPNILAITFTNIAAQQMKSRILLWLKKLSFGKPCPEFEQTKVLLSMPADRIIFAARHMLDHVISHWSDFHVQTIDSFMNRILRASANEIGLPLDIEVTESHRAFVDIALYSTLKEINREISYQQIDRFLAVLNQESDTYQWNPLTAIKRYFQRFLEEEGKVVEAIEFNDYENEIKEIWDQIKIAYKKIMAAGYGKTIRKKIHESIEDNNIRDFLKALDDEGSWFDKRRKSKEVLAICPEFSEKISYLAELRAQAIYGHFNSLYRDFRPLLEKIKKRNWIIHFDDINKQLSNYLNNYNIPDIYCRIGDSLFHFLIDEFQDTDRVQWGNLDPLIDEAFAKGGTLFAVGDTKQAIYMFRKADYRIMRDLVLAIKDPARYGKRAIWPSVKDNAEVVPLKENFRSGEMILQYVDQVFKDVLPRMKDQWELREDPSGLTEYEQHTSKPNQAKGYVKAMIISKSEENSEHQILLSIIGDLKNRFRLRDIAILGRKNSQVETIVEWLTNANINAVSYSSLNIKKRKVIMEIIDLLSFLDSPIDDLSFASFALGDIMAKVIEAEKNPPERQIIVDFLSTKASRQSASLYADFKKDKQLAGLWSDFFEELFNKVGFYPLYDLVLMIFRRFDLFKNFPDEHGFLIKFLETISIIEERGLNDIKSFLDIVYDDDEEGVLDILLPDYIDAVKVMTFHRAKGLGFPVVINMIYDSKGKKDAMHFVKEENALHLYSLTKSIVGKSAKLKRLYEEKNIDEKVQDLNLLYVANTRAEREMYNLVIMRDDQYHDPIFELFQNCELGSKTVSQIRVEADRPSEIMYKAQALAGFDVVEKDLKWTARRWFEIKRGEFIHSILENLSILKDEIAVQLEPLIREQQARSREHYDFDEIKKILLKFLEHQLVREWFIEKKDRIIQNEVEYIDENGALYRIDRILIDPDRLTIIDFKTGFDQSDRHKIQLKRYMELLGKITSEKKVSGYIAYVEKAETVEVL